MFPARPGMGGPLANLLQCIQHIYMSERNEHILATRRSIKKVPVCVSTCFISQNNFIKVITLEVNAKIVQCIQFLKTVFWDVAPRCLVEDDWHFLEMLTASILRVTEAVSTSGTSVNFYQTTRRNNPEDIYIHACRCGNLKSHRN
jgi:hypothetical protein